MSQRTFISYSRKDEKYASSLASYLQILKTRGFVTVFVDLHMVVGTLWEQQLEYEIATADIAICLVTPDYLSSKRCCWELEEFSKRKKVDPSFKLLPIHLKSSPLELVPEFSKFQVTPSFSESVFKKFGEGLDDVGRFFSQFLLDLVSSIGDGDGLSPEAPDPEDDDPGPESTPPGLALLPPEEKDVPQNREQSGEVVSFTEWKKKRGLSWLLPRSVVEREEFLFCVRSVPISGIVGDFPVVVKDEPAFVCEFVIISDVARCAALFFSLPLRPGRQLSGKTIPSRGDIVGGTVIARSSRNAEELGGLSTVRISGQPIYPEDWVVRLDDGAKSNGMTQGVSRTDGAARCAVHTLNLVLALVRWQTWARQERRAPQDLGANTATTAGVPMSNLSKADVGETGYLVVIIQAGDGANGSERGLAPAVRLCVDSDLLAVLQINGALIVADGVHRVPPAVAFHLRVSGETESGGELLAPIPSQFSFSAPASAVFNDDEDADGLAMDGSNLVVGGDPEVTLPIGVMANAVHGAAPPPLALEAWVDRGSGNVPLMGVTIGQGIGTGDVAIGTLAFGVGALDHDFIAAYKDDEAICKYNQGGISLSFKVHIEERTAYLLPDTYRAVEHGYALAPVGRGTKPCRLWLASGFRSIPSPLISVETQAETARHRSRGFVALCRKQLVRFVGEGLVGLVDLKVRELLSSYNFPGDDIPMIQGSALKSGGAEDEWGAKIVELITAVVHHYLEGLKRAIDKDFLMLIEDIFSTQGRGAVATGGIERGVVKVGETIEIVSIRDTTSTTVTGVEMFRKLLGQGEADDNGGVCVGFTLTGRARNKPSIEFNRGSARSAANGSSVVIWSALVAGLDLADVDEVQWEDCVNNRPLGVRAGKHLIRADRKRYPHVQAWRHPDPEQAELVSVESGACLFGQRHRGDAQPGWPCEGSSQCALPRGPGRAGRGGCRRSPPWSLQVRGEAAQLSDGASFYGLSQRRLESACYSRSFGKVKCVEMSLTSRCRSKVVPESDSGFVERLGVLDLNQQNPNWGVDA